MSTQWN